MVAHVAEKVDGGQTEKRLELLSRGVDGGFGKQCGDMTASLLDLVQAGSREDWGEQPERRQLQEL